MDLRLRHVGYVTTDLDAMVGRLAQLFDIPPDEVVRVPADDTPTDTRFAFLRVGDVQLEIIEPVTDRFRDVLIRSGLGTNHVCFTVEDIDAAVADMAAKGVRPGHVTPDGVIQMPHQRMVYFDPADTGGALIEFIEPNRPT